MSHQQKNNPLHGKTLEHIVNSLVEHFGWDGEEYIRKKNVKIRNYYHENIYN